MEKQPHQEHRDDSADKLKDVRNSDQENPEIGSDLKMLIETLKDDFDEKSLSWNGGYTVGDKNIIINFIPDDSIEFISDPVGAFGAVEFYANRNDESGQPTGKKERHINYFLDGVQNILLKESSLIPKVKKGSEYLNIKISVNGVGKTAKLRYDEKDGIWYKCDTGVNFPPVGLI
ncbi:hypothetical protein H7Y21_01495 [Arenimonas sp.]|nr:hypothetical protein [Candidatus Parcubacteria bacterium]